MQQATQEDTTTESWRLVNLSIAYHSAESRWQVEFKCSDGKIIASVDGIARLGGLGAITHIGSRMGLPWAEAAARVAAALRVAEAAVTWTFTTVCGGGFCERNW